METHFDINSEKWKKAVKIADSVVQGQFPVTALLDQVISGKGPTRVLHAIAMSVVSDHQPELLYPPFDAIAGLLVGTAAGIKFHAIHTLANLAHIDGEGKWNQIIEEFLALLDDESVIPASHVAGKAGKVAHAQPQLQSRIIDALLDIDATHHASGRKDLIKAYAIQSLGAFFDHIADSDQRRIRSFVEAQKMSKSPKTRKGALEFLTQWPE